MTSYAGKHRAPAKSRRTVGRLAAVGAGIVVAVLIASPAAAKPIVVKSGDTYSGLVQQHCAPGTSWQALNFGSRNKNLIYAGETIDIACSGATQPSTATPAPQASGWVAPVNACVGSGYGMRWGRMHWGVDLGAGYGTPIRAAAAGMVATAWQSGAGNYSTIVHGNGLATVYMHQSSFAVRSGWVAAGQVIGYVGSTGNSTGPHLHLEVHTAGLWNGKVNPVGFFSARGVTLRWC